jgi:septal ring factor EnvC (AmiA/AmiB activator)
MLSPVTSRQNAAQHAAAYQPADESFEQVNKGSGTGPRMIPVRKLLRYVLVGSVAASVIAAFTLGSLAYANTSNKFHHTRSTLQTTQSTLAATQSELQTTKAKRDEYLRKLRITQAKLAKTQTQLAATQKNLSSTKNQLSSANNTISIQGGQISTLKSCLSGIGTSYGYFLQGNYEAALSALEASGPACDTASSYF